MKLPNNQQTLRSKDLNSCRLDYRLFLWYFFGIQTYHACSYKILSTTCNNKSFRLVLIHTFPQPGGPSRRTPWGGFIPILSKRSGFFKYFTSYQENEINHYENKRLVIFGSWFLSSFPNIKENNAMKLCTWWCIVVSRTLMVMVRVS